MDSRKTNGNIQIKNSEYKELVDFLGVKFEKLDKKFENIDKKFENIDRKFENIDKKFENIDKRFDEVNSKINSMSDRLARLSDKVDDYHADQIGMRRDIDRQEKWHFKIADKVGVDLHE